MNGAVLRLTMQQVAGSAVMQDKRRRKASFMGSVGFPEVIPPLIMLWHLLRLPAGNTPLITSDRPGELHLAVAIVE